LFQAPTDAEIEKIIEIDMTRSEHVRRWWPFLRDRRIDAYSGLVKRFLD
jgi:N-carbamoylputrescine amidase